jgi:hypothetical protein
MLKVAAVAVLIPIADRADVTVAIPDPAHSVIIANANTTRIGFPSSAGAPDAVKDGKTYRAAREDGAFFNMRLPLQHAAGRTIGIPVMEIPFTSTANDAEAIHEAEKIRHELVFQ